MKLVRPRQARKYIEPSNRAKVSKNTNTELGNDTVAQLYDLSKDPGETRNLVAALPQQVNEMSAMLQKIRDSGASRPAR